MNVPHNNIGNVNRYNNSNYSVVLFFKFSLRMLGDTIPEKTSCYKVIF